LRVFSRINNKNNKAIKKLKKQREYGCMEMYNVLVLSFIMGSNMVNSRSGGSLMWSSVSVEV